MLGVCVRQQVYVSVLRMCLYFKSHTDTPYSSPVDPPPLERLTYHQQLGISTHLIQSTESNLHSTPACISAKLDPLSHLSSVSSAKVHKVEQKQPTLVNVVPQL